MAKSKLTNRELFTEKIMDIFYLFITGNTVEYDKRTKKESLAREMIPSLLSIKTLGADVREALSARLLGWNHNSSINGYDAVTAIDNRLGEIKTESLRGDGLYLDNIDEWLEAKKREGKSVSYKLCGRTRWDNCTKSKSMDTKYKNKLERLQKENPRMGLVGWCGAFPAYAVTFDFNEGKDFSRKLKMSTPTTSTSDWVDAPSLKLKYINVDFLDKKYMDNSLYTALKNIIEKNNKEL